MSPGSYNGHNYSGGHTGKGKKQNKSIYSLGYRDIRQPNHNYTLNTQVYDKQTGETGILIEKKRYKSKRSIRLVKTNSRMYYTHTHNLRILSKSIESTESVESVEPKGEDLLDDYEIIEHNS